MKRPLGRPGEARDLDAKQRLGRTPSTRPSVLPSPGRPVARLQAIDATLWCDRESVHVEWMPERVLTVPVAWCEAEIREPMDGGPLQLTLECTRAVEPNLPKVFVRVRVEQARVDELDEFVDAVNHRSETERRSWVSFRPTAATEALLRSVAGSLPRNWS